MLAGLLLVTAVLYFRGYWEPLEDLDEEIAVSEIQQHNPGVITKRFISKPLHPGDTKYMLPMPEPYMPDSVAAQKENLHKKAVDSFNNGNYETAAALFAEISKHDRRALLGLGLSYYKLGDYRSAARFLEEAIAEKGIDEFQVRKFLAFTYYQMDELDESLRSAESALSIHEDADLRGLMAKLSREKPAQENFIQDETLHFKVLFDGHENGHMSTLVLSILEDAYIAIGAEMGHFPKDTITVVLYSGQDFYDITQMPDWTGGVFDGKIRIPLRGVEEYDRDVLKRVLYHEYVHALVFSLAPRCPTWINEGLAMYLSGAERQKIGQKIPLKDLERSFPESQGQSNIAYDESYSAVSQLIGDYGIYSFRAFLIALSEGQNLEDAFSSSFFESYSDFINSWGED